MSWLAFLIVSASLTLSNCLPWDAPAQTLIGATNTANWSPAPTNNCQTDFGLLPRALYDNSICGFIGGSAALLASCSTDSSCAWNSDESYVGCCATSNNECTFYTSCVDLNSPKQTGDNANVYTCVGTSVCYQNTYPNDFLQWGCGSSDYATFVATTNGENGSVNVVITGNTPSAAASSSASPAAASSSSITTTSSSSESSSSVATSSTLISPSTTRSTSVSSSLAQAPSSTFPASVSLPSSTPPTPSQKSVPIGAIVGGVIGGLALISAILCFCFIGRRRGWFDSDSSNKRMSQSTFGADIPPHYSTPIPVGYNLVPKAELATHEHNLREMSTYNDEGTYGGEEVSPAGSPVPASEGTMVTLGPRSRVSSPTMTDEMFLPSGRNEHTIPMFEVQ